MVRKKLKTCYFVRLLAFHFRLVTIQIIHVSVESERSSKTPTGTSGLVVPYSPHRCFKTKSLENLSQLTIIYPVFQELADEERKHFFNHTLKRMAALALQLPHLCTCVSISEPQQEEFYSLTSRPGAICSKHC